MSDRIEGSLEAVIDGRAIGWAWDPEAPGDALEVEVLVDGRPAASGIAGIEREVLAAAGIGSGRYGFDLALPEELGGDASREIQVGAGPDRIGLAPFEGFETVSRFPDGPWGATIFVAEGVAPPPEPYVPEEEEPLDAGDAALIGRDGWLFVRDDSNLGLDHLTGAPLLTPEGVERRCEVLTAQYRRVRALRIPCLSAAAPMKERFHAEQLPEGSSTRPRQPLRRLNAALKAAGGGEVVDLLPPIRDGGEGPAFPKTGSNWSDRGAFRAYRELMLEAAKRVVDLGEPLREDQVSFSPRPGYAGDLAAKPKFELVDGEFVAVASPDEAAWVEEIEVADVSRLRSLRLPAPDHLEVAGRRAPRLYEIPNESEMPRAVLVGDASCLALIQWLAEHFRRFVFLWADSELPLEAIELESPDLVIHVVSERLLVREP